MMIDVSGLLHTIGLRAPRDAIAAFLTHATKSRLAPTETCEQLVALDGAICGGTDLAA